jgi:radical SAM protein with 4Fe4S-binding SPASM domain
LSVELPFVVFEITSKCNLDCRYCYNIWKRPGVNHEPYNSYRQAKKTLKKLFSVAEVGQVAMSGGEPFLSERFAEIVLFCRMKKKSVAIITNGNAAGAGDYKQMFDLGVTLFELPMHSFDAEVHDRMTRVPGSWAKSLGSIREVLELGGSPVAVIVITRANHMQVGRTLEFLHETGVRRVMLNRFNIGGRGIEEKDSMLVGPVELRAAFRAADETAGRLPLSITSNVCTPFCVLNPKDYKRIRVASCSASAINMPLTLDVYGNLRLCNHSPVVVGNIFEDRLEALLDGEYSRGWKKTVPEFCDGCKVYSTCYGGCRAASEQLGQGLDTVDPLVSLCTDSVVRPK